MARLVTNKQWLCPLQDIKDLSGQFAALHMHPLGCSAYQQGLLARGLGDLNKELLLIMRTLIMRHSKKSVQESGAWSLPPKTEELVPINLSSTEWQAYKSCYDSVRRAFEVYENGGAATCNKHVIAIMALLAPLRRLCSGGTHSLSSLTVALPNLTQHKQAPVIGPAEDGPRFPSPDDMECAICFETFENPARTNVCFSSVILISIVAHVLSGCVSVLLVSCHAIPPPMEVLSLWSTCSLQSC
jgi:SNF2-related domain